MALRTEFLRKLKRVMEYRTDSIKRMVIPGVAKKWDRKKRDKLRRELLDSASQVLVREIARKEFKKLVHNRRPRSISGRGIQNRFDHVFSWARRNLHGPIVYSFWKGSRCLYVGKGRSYKRLRGYRGSIYLMVADSLKAWRVKSRNKLASAECLAVHLFNPSRNENHPAKVKWGKRCPVCRRHRGLKNGLDSLLRLKG